MFSRPVPSTCTWARAKTPLPPTLRGRPLKNTHNNTNNTNITTNNNTIINKNNTTTTTTTTTTTNTN